MTIEGSKVGITLAAMAAATMAVLDISIVNVALSDIRADFGTPLDQIGWISTGYMMANVVVIPMTGWFQRRFGFRRYFTASILMFTAASVLCGLAWSLPVLVLCRILQGMGGGAIIPTAQAILFARYPREEHSMASSLFGLGAVSGPLLGPTLGGYLIDVSSWHWIFLVNVPVGLVAAYLAWRHIREPGLRPTPEPVDRHGIALLVVGMATLQYVLEEGNRKGWMESPEIAVLAGISAVSLLTFIVHELDAPHPIVDLRIFRNRSYAAGTGVNFLLGFALFSGMFLFSLFCGSVMHYSALDIGLIFLTAGSIQICTMPLIGRFSGRFDPRPQIALGMTITCTSLFLNSRLNTDCGFWELAHPQMVRALGMGLVMIPLSVTALSDLTPAQRGNGAGLFNLTRELGGSIGTAWMGMNVSNLTTTNAASLAANVTLFSRPAMDRLDQMRRSLGAGSWNPDALAIGALNGRVHAQAAVKAFNQGFLEAALAFACGLLFVLLLKRPRGGMKGGAGAH